jgi:HEAT repeat protein
MAASLREFFERMVQDYGTSPLPTSDDIGRMGERLDHGSAAEISDALPAIFVAASHGDATVRLVAALALQSISLRPDKSKLLPKHLLPLKGLISSEDPRVVAFTVTTLANVWPEPPPEVIPGLLDYLKRQDADWRTQADVLRYVISGADGDPEMETAVMQFWSRPLSKDARIGAIEALANGNPKDPRIISLAMASLDDPDFNVRLTAFQAVWRMGPAAMRQAEFPMQKAAQQYVSFVKRVDADPNEQVSVIEELLMVEPNDPEVVDAVIGFYSRPRNVSSRTSVQNALRTPRIKDARLVDLVISSLQDTNPEVRANAAYVLADMGPQAVARARKPLNKLAQDPSQPTGVRQGVKRALAVGGAE